MCLSEIASNKCIFIFFFVVESYQRIILIQESSYNSPIYSRNYKAATGIQDPNFGWNYNMGYLTAL